MMLEWGGGGGGGGGCGKFHFRVSPPIHTCMSLVNNHIYSIPFVGDNHCSSLCLF